jgi:hypothetical protein
MTLTQKQQNEIVNLIDEVKLIDIFTHLYNKGKKHANIDDFYSIVSAYDSIMSDTELLWRGENGEGIDEALERADEMIPKSEEIENFIIKLIDQQLPGFHDYMSVACMLDAEADVREENLKYPYTLSIGNYNYKIREYEYLDYTFQTPSEHYLFEVRDCMEYPRSSNKFDSQVEEYSTRIAAELDRDLLNVADEL